MTEDLDEFRPGVRALLDSVSSERLASRTLELVRIPSPSGQEEAVAAAYKDMLSAVGLRVQEDREFAESPSLITRLEGPRGRVLQLDGHLDTVPDLMHQTVERRDDVIYGRGACDMKGGLAVIAEVLQVLVTNQVRLLGSLLVTAHGQHEQSVGGRELHAPLRGLLKRGIKGDAVIIPEGPHDCVALSGRGAAIFSAVFERPGEPVHEILGGETPPPNPLMAAHRFVSLLSQKATTWTINDDLVGPEVFFVGTFHSGDLYNRIPVRAELSGTRRYPTGRTFDEVRDELEVVARHAASDLGVDVKMQVDKSGQPFRLSEGEPIVSALRYANLHVTGRDLPPKGIRYSGDVSQFMNDGSVPALYHGTDQRSAHSDLEFVPIPSLVRCAKVLLLSAIRFLGLE